MQQKIKWKSNKYQKSICIESKRKVLSKLSTFRFRSFSLKIRAIFLIVSIFVLCTSSRLCLLFDQFSNNFEQIRWNCMQISKLFQNSYTNFNFNHFYFTFELFETILIVFPSIWSIFTSIYTSFATIWTFSILFYVFQLISINNNSNLPSPFDAFKRHAHLHAPLHGPVRGEVPKIGSYRIISEATHHLHIF